MQFASLHRAGRIIAAVAVAAAGAMASTTHAGTITYTISGVADGSVGKDHFYGFTFSLTATGDTRAVSAVAPGIPCVDPKHVTFSVDGFASGSITTPVSVAENAGWQLIAIAAGRCVDGGPMWTNGRNSRFGSYDLASKLEPVALSLPSVTPTVVVETSEGALALHKVSALTFTAQTALPLAAAAPVVNVVTVPTLGAGEIGLLTLLLAGMGGIAARRRLHPDPVAPRR